MLTSVLVSIFLLFSTINAQSLLSTIEASGDFTAYASGATALSTTNLALLEAPLPVTTVFCPNDQAANLAALGNTSVYLYSMVVTALDVAALVGVSGSGVATVEGSNIRINADASGNLYANGQAVLASHPDVDGFVHEVGVVLEPLGAMAEAAVELGLSTFFNLTAAADASLSASFNTASETEGYTIFCPSDAAFASALSAEVMASLELETNADVAMHILASHIAETTAYATVEVGAAVTTITSIDGKQIVLDTTSSTEATVTSSASASAEAAVVTTADIYASNGLIHEIDAVLMPTFNCYQELAIQGANEFRALVQGSAEFVADITVNATSEAEKITLCSPTDAALEAFAQTEAYAAFESALEFNLRGHVFAGAQTTADWTNEQKVNATNGVEARINKYGDVTTCNCIPFAVVDAATDNGVVHQLDGVVTAVEADMMALLESETSTFASLSIEAGVDASLTGEGPYTVFAPSAKAFVKLEAEYRGITQWLIDNPSQLETLLNYHILAEAETQCAAAFETATEATTAVVTRASADASADAEVTVAGNAMWYGDARVIGKNTMATNGVVHVINKVLFPSDFESQIPTSLSASYTYSTFVPQTTSTFSDVVTGGNTEMDVTGGSDSMVGDDTAPPPPPGDDVEESSTDASTLALATALFALLA